MTHVVRRWSKADDLYIRDKWEREDLADIAKALRRTEDAVKQRAYRLIGTTLDREPTPGRTKGRRTKTRTEPRNPAPGDRCNTRSPS